MRNREINVDFKIIKDFFFTSCTVLSLSEKQVIMNNSINNERYSYRDRHAILTCRPISKIIIVIIIIAVTVDLSKVMHQINNKIKRRPCRKLLLFIPASFGFQHERKSSKGSMLSPISALSLGTNSPTLYVMLKHNSSSKLNSKPHYSAQCTNQTLRTSLCVQLLTLLFLL